MKKEEKETLKTQIMASLRAKQTVNKQEVLNELLGPVFAQEYITAILTFNDARNELALEGIDYRPTLNGTYSRSDVKQTLHRASKDRRAAMKKLSRSGDKLTGIKTDKLDPHTAQVVKRSKDKTDAMTGVFGSLTRKRNFTNVPKAIETIKAPVRPKRIKKGN